MSSKFEKISQLLSSNDEKNQELALTMLGDERIPNSHIKRLLTAIAHHKAKVYHVVKFFEERVESPRLKENIQILKDVISTCFSGGCIADEIEVGYQYNLLDYLSILEGSLVDEIKRLREELEEKQGELELKNTEIESLEIQVQNLEEQLQTINEFTND